MATTPLTDLFGQPLAWQRLALCAQTDPEAFFPEMGQNGAVAKRVCARCEVRVQCLEYALDTNQEYGVWGGTGRRERELLARQAA